MAATLKAGMTGCIGMAARYAGSTYVDVAWAGAGDSEQVLVEW